MTVIAAQDRFQGRKSHDGRAFSEAKARPEAFKEIFDRHHRAIWGLLARRFGAQTADDLTAETFEVAFRRRSEFDASRADALPWLFGIALNLGRRHRRKESMRLRELSVVGVNHVAVGDSAHSGPVAQAILQLNSMDRDVLLLFAIADLSYREVSDALSIPEGTVRSKLHRARRLLREALENDRA